MQFETQSLIASVALGACWLLESVLPGVHASRVGAARCRHLALGALNGIPGLAIVACLVFCESGARDFGAGVIRAASMPAWCIGIVAFLLLDLCQYAGHVLMHKVPLLWRLHAVHHHAEQVESTTAFRFHTIEIVLQGVMLFPLVVLLGVRVHEIAIYNAILLPASLFHHANMRIPKRLEDAMGLVVVTPGLHRLHHARWQPLTDSNYSAVLSIWDRLFGTLSRHPSAETVPVGLDGYTPEHTETVRGMLMTPFTDARAGLGSPPGSWVSQDKFLEGDVTGGDGAGSKTSKGIKNMNTNEHLNNLYIPLRLCYGLVPVVAGADKFTNLLTDWSQYLPEALSGMLPFEAGVFMMIVGVIEIVAGLAVLTKFTRLGGYVVMAWLLLIAVNVAVAGYLDIAVRDIVMALGAYTLAGLAAYRGEQLLPGSGEHDRHASTIAS